MSEYRMIKMMRGNAIEKDGAIIERMTDAVELLNKLDSENKKLKEGNLSMENQFVISRGKVLNTVADVVAHLNELTEEIKELRKKLALAESGIEVNHE